MLKKINVIVVCALLLLCGSSFASGDGFIIKYGYMNESSSDYKVTYETTKIPLKLKNTGFRFGYTVKQPDNTLFEGYYILYLPAPPKKVTDSAKETIVSNEGTVFKKPQKKFNGFWGERFWFDEGDPLGNWRIEIYINSKLVKTIDFTVVTPD